MNINLGNTYGMCVLQDFEALTPNLLARTIETVEGGGSIVILLKVLYFHNLNKISSGLISIWLFLHNLIESTCWLLFKRHSFRQGRRQAQILSLAYLYILNIDFVLIKKFLGCDVTETAVRHDYGCSCQVHLFNLYYLPLCLGKYISH